MNRARRLLCCLLAGAWPAMPHAQPAPEQITVIAAPAPASLGDMQLLDSNDLRRDGAPDLLAALGSRIAGVNLDSATGNPFQPTLFYDGFAASPLQGTAQGIAVYVNGIRFNQAFGDTVNWELIPPIAIQTVKLAGSNPAFGLNALGGSIDARLRNGFTYQGAEADLSGGAFGQAQATFQYGRRTGADALYVAGDQLHQDGWRDLQSSDIQTLFADLGTQRDARQYHATLTLAQSSLNGPGTSPVQLLAADPAAQFTAPNVIGNRFAQTSLSVSRPLATGLSLQATTYYSYFQQRVANGNVADDAPCNDGSLLLCADPGMPSTTRGGAPIPDFLAGGPYSVLNRQTTNTNAYGASGQLAGIPYATSHLVIGAGFDGAQTLFSATDAIGGLDAARSYVGPGVTIDEPGTDVPVRVAVDTGSLGVFASDTLDLTGTLAATISARLNAAEIDLHDEGGGTLSGHHAYTRLNPAIGVTQQATPWLTAYAGYSEADRAPTPAELSCAGPQDSCSLANFFVGDPDLKQVVAHTMEAGVRGRAATAWRLGYDIALFRTDSDDDIAFVNSSSLGRAFFANVGQTRRQGARLRLDAARGHCSVYVAATYTQAIFRTGFIEAAGNNPGAAPDGTVAIRPGDSLPGIPRITLKFGADAPLTQAWQAGLDAVVQSGQYLFGDEANLTARLPGFVTVDLHSTYQLTPGLQLFAALRNATNARYYSYGTFSPTGSVFLKQAPGATDPRAYSPAAPIGAFGGVRVTF